MVPKGIYIKKATCIVLFYFITGYAQFVQGFKNYIPTFSTAYCNVSNSSSKMNAFKGSRITFKSLVSTFSLWNKGHNKWSGRVQISWQSKDFFVQSNAMTSSSSSLCSIRDLFALLFSLSSNFLLRLLSSSLLSALFEGLSSSESTMSTSSCSCAYFRKKEKLVKSVEVISGLPIIHNLKPTLWLCTNFKNGYATATLKESSHNTYLVLNCLKCFYTTSTNFLSFWGEGLLRTEPSPRT